jgi:hypothetical protein
MVYSRQVALSRRGVGPYGPKARAGRKGFTHRILNKYSTTYNCLRYFFILHMTYFRL